MSEVTDRAVTYSADGCKVNYYDVLLRFKITEHEGVYDWYEYDRDSTTIAQLKTGMQTQADNIKTKIEARLDVTVS